MTPLQAYEAINAALVDGMGSTPIALNDERWRPAVGVAWIRVTIKSLAGRGLSLGSPGNRRADRRGVVIVQAFAPLATADGIAAAMTLAQTAAALLEGRDLDNPTATAPVTVNCAQADVGPVGIDRGWSQANAEIPFSFVEIV